MDDGYHLVGDKAYGGYSNILIPGVTEIAVIENFTENLANQRIRVENTFGLLKGKFKLFQYSQYKGKNERFIKLLISAAVIHNLLIYHNQ